MDVSELSAYTIAKTDYPVVTDKINVKGEPMLLVDLLDMGVKGNIIIHSFSTSITSSNHKRTNIRIFIGKWYLRIVPEFVDNVRCNITYSVLPGDSYDVVNMKYTNKEVTFSFTKDDVTKYIVLKNFIALYVTMRLRELNSIVHTCWI